MATYGSLAYDRRVQLEAMTLAHGGHRVTLYCRAYGGPIPEALTTAVRVVEHRGPSGNRRRTDATAHVSTDGPKVAGSTLGRGVTRAVNRLRWLIDYRRELLEWGRWVAADGQGSEVWHLHDYPTLSAIAPRLRGRTRYIYDSHELFFESGTAARLPAPLRRWLARGERRWVRQALAVVTVNESCAAVIRLMKPIRVAVVHNCPPSTAPSVTDGTVGVETRPLRATIGIDDGIPLVLYHGILGPHRGLEELIAAMALPELAGAHLALLGFGILRASLEALAGGASVIGRVHLVEAVVPEDLPIWIADADVEAIAIQHSTLNHYLSTPNKLFEAIAVGVPVVVSDFPEMHRIVLDGPFGQLGRTCEPSDPSSIAAAISSILGLPPDRRQELRASCLQASRERWNWEREGSALLKLYDEVSNDVSNEKRRAMPAIDTPRG